MNHDFVLGDVKISNVTQRTITVIGGKGSGKTQTLKMFSAILNNNKIPVIFFDMMNIVRIEGFDRIIITRKHIEKGKDLGEIISKNKFKKGLILSFVELNQDEITQFANPFFSSLKIKDSIIIIDEVHELAPERGMGMEYSTEFERAVRHWRNKNIGFIFSSQRPAFASKKVLGLTDFILLYRITWTADIKVAKELISGMLTEEQTDQIMQSIQTKDFLEGYTIDFIPVRT